MYLLPKDCIDGWWPLVSPLLAKAWDTTPVGDSLSLQDVRSRLESGGHHCFITSDRKLAGVFSCYDTPKAKFLNFYLNGGEEPDCGWQGVDEFLTEVAKVFGCQFIQLEGRLGWKRKVEPLGYRVDSLIMTKEVTQ